eukprot:c23449_g1_i1 orf=220-1875(-)
METEALGDCRQPTNFYLMGVALRSFFLVLATHLLAGEVDTTLAGLPLTRRLSWWSRYYNPLNLSWRYYSMFAYRFTARLWGTHQLALINHEEHPLLPPVPYIVGETVRTLHVRRLEMAGLLSSQGILTFSAAYQGALAIQYAISTEGIPYLPNTTVPLAMVGLFRVMASKWVASKIQVDAYPYPCVSSSSAASECFQLNAYQSPLSAPMGELGTDLSTKFSPTTKSCKDPSRASIRRSNSERSPRKISSFMTESDKDPSSFALSIIKSHRDSSLNPLSITKLNIEPVSLSSTSSQWCLIAPPVNQLRSSPLLSSPSSPLTYPASPSISQSLLPKISRQYSLLSSSPKASGSLTSANVCTGTSPSMSSCTYTSSLSHSRLLPTAMSPSEMSKANTCMFPSLSSCATSSQSCPSGAPISSSSPSLVPAQICQVHPHPPFDYKSNKFVVGGWIGVLVGLVTMSFLPYKVVAAYQLPRTFLQFSMQLFYQYIAVSEFVFHAYLLFQGPKALANRVLFFDHWSFKAQTVGFYCLLLFMLVIALHDFIKHEFYRSCA